MARMVKTLPATQEPQVQPLGWEGSLQTGEAACSRVLTWEIPWTREPGGLQSTGSQSVGHD